MPAAPDRPLADERPCLWFDVPCLRVRQGVRIISVTTIIAFAVNTGGRRESESLMRHWFKPYEGGEWLLRRPIRGGNLPDRVSAQPQGPRIERAEGGDLRRSYAGIWVMV